MPKFYFLLAWIISHLRIPEFLSSSSDENCLCHEDEESSKEKNPLNTPEVYNDSNGNLDATDEDYKTPNQDSDFSICSENTSEPEVQERIKGNDWFVEKHNESDTNTNSYTCNSHVYDENYGIIPNSFLRSYYLGTIPEVDEPLYDSDVLYASFDANGEDEISIDENMGQSPSVYNADI